MPPVAEVRTLIERAAARRLALEGLLDSVPGDYWERRAPGDAWTALDHVRHLATVDEIVVELVEAAVRTEAALWLGGTNDPRALEAQRAALLDGVQEQALAALRAAMHRTRQAVVAALLPLPSTTLGREVRVAGVTTPWGEPRAFTLRAYLAIWAAHDGEHEHAIRRAIETPPDASTLTLGAWRSRRGGTAR